jgi:iron(III) transport system ATP-binding protein
VVVALVEHSVIALEGVSKSYAGFPAVRDISLQVARGQLLVLLGSSGCGKSTTLRLIAGLERPDEGEIWLDGNRVAGNGAWTPAEKRRVGMVFQDYALFPHLSSSENIAFPLQSLARTQRQQRVEELLALVGMEGLGDRYPHQLSGGQQQRVALARALAPHPAIVLLDEPFSNLDAARRKQVREEVRDILKLAGATGIFVTHDQEEAMGIADVIAVMQGGRIIEVGDPPTLYRYPALPEVARFLGEMNRIPGTAHGAAVQTALGSLPLARAAYGAVTVMVRPEAIQLQQGTDTNAIVQSVRFRGHYQMVTIRLADGTLLEARVWAHVDIRPGEAVRASVPGAVIAFAEAQRPGG